MDRRRPSSAEEETQCDSRERGAAGQF